MRTRSQRYLYTHTTKKSRVRGASSQKQSPSRMQQTKITRIGLRHFLILRALDKSRPRIRSTRHVRWRRSSDYMRTIIDFCTSISNSSFLPNFLAFPGTAREWNSSSAFLPHGRRKLLKGTERLYKEPASRNARITPLASA